MNPNHHQQWSRKTPPINARQVASHVLLIRGTSATATSDFVFDESLLLVKNKNLINSNEKSETGKQKRASASTPTKEFSLHANQRVKEKNQQKVKEKREKKKIFVASSNITRN